MTMQGDYENARQSLRDRVRRLRVARGWSQDKLGERSGLPRQTIAHVERWTKRGPSFSTLCALASAFKMRLSELVDEP